jgi:hypothetical protein
MALTGLMPPIVPVEIPVVNSHATVVSWYLIDERAA